MRCRSINKSGKICKNNGENGICKLHVKNTGLNKKELYDIFDLPKDIFSSVMLYLDYNYLKIFCDKANNQSLLSDKYFLKEYSKRHSTCYIKNIYQYLMEKDDKDDKDDNNDENNKKNNDKCNINLNIWLNRKNFYKNKYLADFIKIFCTNFDAKILMIGDDILKKTEDEQKNYCLQNNIPFNMFNNAKSEKDIHLISKDFMERMYYLSNRFSIGNYISQSLTHNKYFYAEQLLKFNFSAFDFTKNDNKEWFDYIFTTILKVYKKSICKYQNSKHSTNIDYDVLYVDNVQSKIKFIKKIMSFYLETETPQLKYNYKYLI